jgi:hypothetical protein
MKLLKIYQGTIKAMQNTPFKIAIFTNGKDIKIFEKVFYINNLNRPNWFRNIVLEKYNNVKIIEEKLIYSGLSLYKIN